VSVLNAVVTTERIRVIRMTRFKVLSLLAVWAVPSMFFVGGSDHAQTQSGPQEAVTGFDNEDNGFAREFCANQRRLTDSPNSPLIPDAECNLATAIEEFTGPEADADGVGPIFNARGCGECHVANHILCATSQFTEKRAGLFLNGVFTDHPGGSLIQERTIAASTNVTALRSTLSVLGDGFVEAIANTTLQNIANNQPAAQRGQLI